MLYLPHRVAEHYALLQCSALPSHHTLHHSCAHMPLAMQTQSLHHLDTTTTSPPAPLKLLPQVIFAFEKSISG